MADLNKSLQDYLSRSSSSTSLPKSDSTSSSLSSGFSGFGLFKKQNIEEPSPTDTSGNWFAQAQSDPLLPSLSKKQRILGFVTCLLLGTFCMSLASLYIPLLIMKARKFALLYSLGSLFIISSFSFLWGPVHHVKHLFSLGRLPFTAAYFGTMLLTLYFAMWVKSTIFTVIFAIAQVIALICSLFVTREESREGDSQVFEKHVHRYIISYIPGGQTGLKFFTKIFYSAASKTAQKTLPI